MTAHVKAGRPIFFDLSGRTSFRVTGTDRLRFLNGQITNDLRKASETSAIEACILNAKGKIDAHVFISVAGESFFIDAAPGLRETLKARLERYVIADDVQVEDTTDQFSLFHVLSQQPPGWEYGRTVSACRFADPGWDIWAEAAARDALLKQLSSELKRCDSDAAEAMRIEQGIPRWGRELTNEIIPIEANLEQRAIDYQKGCYIGQEVISRIKMSGQTNKRLCGLISLENVPLQPGMKLVSQSEPGKEAGWITSATNSEGIGNEIALGYVKRGFNSVGTKLAAVRPGATEGSRPIRLKVVSLPFV
ncbi:MAG TPA: glycine cleavage T C-terminal barrel domain-containing protein [Candidatus Udaeobacter sp.]|jgi:folate-binding protein YgfZ|nr:glycine cleavage T C-terminal barrel domain-containing protein [Candidatus Udaeobacter sp.]